MTTRRVFMAGMGAGGALLLRPGVAAAQAQPRAEYPDHPVRIVVPYAAGGGNDLLARIYGQKLAEAFNQPFVVDNRPGASAVIGTEAVIRARPDGYTLVVHASGPVLAEKGAGKPAYDRQVDLTPIAVLGAFAGMVLVRADHPARSVAELVTWLRANPAKGNFGTGGTGFQLLGAYFAQRAGLSLEGVIYRSSADGVTALAGGDVTLAFSDPGPARAAIEGGRVRPLAVSSTNRLSGYPDVPTMVEAGFADFVVDYWIGLFGPAGLPPEVLRRLSGEVRRIAALPDVREKLALNSVEPSGLDPEEFRRAIIANDALWVAVAQRAGISLER
ncbi:Bug family tripartite tricarboxylate transporter substrate binding protein [Roseomonas populi]|uniref:Tripartite tricarboxylate transporter substrate binding protein n=1 Tax=Roseomonas populi TaxID=3121582 RepID=A0ABT1X894_9PROT|nr:tripartite tricarboxylate transporter substrate binding protein [Roseomonas pecuniae]MCR0983357.1 tripartite tricarboxylate transporter substrate binding protein [Roseomonas pecuniae]